MNNNTNKASKELVDLIDELKDNLTNVKYLLKRLKKWLERKDLKRMK